MPDGDERNRDALERVTESARRLAIARRRKELADRAADAMSVLCEAMRAERAKKRPVSPDPEGPPPRDTVTG